MLCVFLYGYWNVVFDDVGYYCDCVVGLYDVWEVLGCEQFVLLCDVFDWCDVCVVDGVYVCEYVVGVDFGVEIVVYFEQFVMFVCCEV